MKKLIPLIIIALLLGAASSCKNKNISYEEEETSASGESAYSSPEDIGDKNLTEGKSYIEEQMKNDKAFIKTSSGLCYKIIKEGNGPNFNENDVVDVIYVGKHINGTEFDNSQGNIVPFPLQNVIPGFREVVTLMKPGSKVLTIIPSNLAYGEMGVPQGGIEPNETLVFEITTVGLHK